MQEREFSPFCRIISFFRLPEKGFREMAVKKGDAGSFAESEIMGFFSPATLNQTVFLSGRCYHPTTQQSTDFFTHVLHGKKSGGVCEK